LDAETEDDLARSMRFPNQWDPFFHETMTIAAVYTSQPNTSTSTATNSPSPDDVAETDTDDAGAGIPHTLGERARN
jgi:hypothetical protein